MAEVAVVGAGIGGLAVAARLAKLGHRVTVFEQEPFAGGTLRSIERDGFRWDAGASATGLPAALRDLFRKSGRPIERYVDLVPSSSRHVFADGTTVDLPTGSRAAQIRALDDGLGAGAGRRWAEFVDGQAGAWDAFRRSRAGPDAEPDPSTGAAREPQPGRRSLRRVLTRDLSDARLRDLVAHRYVLAGSDLHDVPAVAAVGAYLERSFGVWKCATGLAQVAAALVVRLGERGAEIRYANPVARILVRGERVCGVEAADGSRAAADVVVAAVDPFQVFAALLDPGRSRAARVFRAQRRVDPPAVTHLGLRDEGSDDVADEVVLHGDPLVVVSTTGVAPPGHRAWTVRQRGQADDVLAVLADRGLDVRGQVVTRLDRSPRQVLAEPGGSSYAVAWDGWRAYARRSEYAQPVAGLHVLAASLTPGATIPQVVWTAAHIANRIGKA
jgi:phytoene dehydrogenase-like protein